MVVGVVIAFAFVIISELSQYVAVVIVSVFVAVVSATIHITVSRVY